KAASISEGVLAVDRVPNLPADRIPSLDKLNGQLPAERILGQLSQWVTNGSTISYLGNVYVGSQSEPDFPGIARNAIQSMGLSAIATMEIALTRACNLLPRSQTNPQGE